MKRSTLISIIMSLVIIAGLILLLVFTSGNQRQDRFDRANLDNQNVVIQDANVEEIEIMILESFPVQVQVAAYGTFPDGCTELSDIVRERNENIFNVALITERPRDAACTQVVRDFEQTFSLDVQGLPAGEYLVNVNGVQDTFSLAVDNIIDFQEGKK